LGVGVRVITVLHKKTELHPRLEALQFLDFTNWKAFPWPSLIDALNRLKKVASASLSSSTLVPQNNAASLPDPPQKPKVSWLEAGKVFLERKEYEEALRAYSEVIFQDHNDAAAYAGKSEALFKLKRSKEALATSEIAIRLAPNLARAWANKGNALNSLKRYQEALAACEKALQLEPELALAWKDKGDALYNLERYEEALQAYQEALRLDSNYAAAWNN